jgi:hypothetical protein
MNGVQMNGVQMNGVQMNGVQMNGVQMNGVQMNGVAVNGLALDGTFLRGTIIDVQSWCPHSQRVTGGGMSSCSPCSKVVVAAQPSCATTWGASCVSAAADMCTVTPDQLVGAVFTADTNAGPRFIRLDGYQLAPDPAPVWRRIGRFWFDANADVYAYHFSFYTRSYLRGYWSPLCGTTPDTDNMVNAAIPVAGHWNDCTTGKANGCGTRSSSDGYSLACNDVGALAKCVQRFQYKPWKSVSETAWAPEGQPVPTHMQSLDKFHQACVRMVRGDYCGDGNAHTVNGTYINVWDHPGVQTASFVPVSYRFEAEWTPAGAGCISLTRYQTWNGNMNPGPNDLYPDAIAACPDLSPVRNIDGHVYIVDGCGNFGGNLATEPDTDPNAEWLRTTFIANQSSH